jgi:stringent starvation protein B
MSDTPTPPSDSQGTSTRPYLVRALHDWCTDNGFTPYLAVFVDASVRVPTEYVKNNEIVLNVGFEATSGLKLGNEFIEFKARFGGVAREIMVPIDHVVAIYARENGQGMAFPMPNATTDAGPSAAVPGAAEAPGMVHRPVRGLRLARPDATDSSRALESVPTSSQPGDEPSDDTPPPQAPRPSLKRVK